MRAAGMITLYVTSLWRGHFCGCDFSTNVLRLPMCGGLKELFEIHCAVVIYKIIHYCDIVV